MLADLRRTRIGVIQLRVWPPHELRRFATQRSFAPRSVTFSSLLLRPHVPVLNCLPVPSPFGSLWVLAVWTLHGWSSGPSRRYLCQSFTGCLDPYPGCLRGALTRFFPRSFGLPQVENGSALATTRTATSVRNIFRGCSHSLMFKPLACLPPRSLPPMRCCCMAAMASTSEHRMGRYLPILRICLPSESGN